jgi:hypothetical protein
MRATPILLAALAAVLLSACGGASNDNPTNTSASGQNGQRPRLALTSEQTSCLQQHGVDLTRGFGGPNGARPNRTPQAGGAPNLTDKQRQQFMQQRQQRAAAFQACGITLPQRGQGGPPGGGNGQPPASGGAQQ